MFDDTFHVYDTTLRDGAQQEGLTLSVADKLVIARQLDELGVGFIEGGWPGAIPKDTEFFRRAATELDLRHAQLAAFGATRRPGAKAADDPQVAALRESGAPVVTLVAKSHDRHVLLALRTTLEENLKMIADTITHLREHGQRVFLDAEHFFDGYRSNPDYALEVVRTAAQAGADVVFNYNKAKEAAKELEKEAEKHGTRVEAFKADVGRHADNKKLVEQAIARLGRLDIVVANAGVWNQEDLPIEKMNETQWDDMIRINLKSVYSIIHFAVPHMIKQKSGRIITISSTAGQRGESFHTHYGASKGAIISLTKGLATELAPHGILVNSVAPGWVATDMSNAVLETKSGQKMAAAAIPLGRPATAEEIAGPILFLASDLANFLTGEIINVNGGSVLCG